MGIGEKRRKQRWHREALDGLLKVPRGQVCSLWKVSPCRLLQGPGQTSTIMVPVTPGI